MDVSPRHVICLLGDWESLSGLDAAVQREFPGFEIDHQYSQLSADPRMFAAFEASQDRLAPTMQDGDWESVKHHRAVVYVLSARLDVSNAQEISGRSLELIASMFLKGAVAAKSESAGLVHGKGRWLSLANDYRTALISGDSFKAGATLYDAWVQRCLRSSDGSSIYSVGMHLLGHREIEFANATDPLDAIRWIDLLGYYLLADRPERPIKDGEGFRLTEDGPRRVIKQFACDRYPSDDFFYNPYGYNCLIDVDATAQRGRRF